MLLNVFGNGCECLCNVHHVAQCRRENTIPTRTQWHQLTPTGEHQTLQSGCCLKPLYSFCTHNILHISNVSINHKLRKNSSFLPANIKTFCNVRIWQQSNIRVKLGAEVQQCGRAIGRVHFEAHSEGRQVTVHQRIGQVTHNKALLRCAWYWSSLQKSGTSQYYLCVLVKALTLLKHWLASILLSELQTLC